MTCDQVTRCPHCQAVFRVNPEQLTQARGWLRCGQCREVFDSTGLTVSWSPEPDVQAERMDLKALLKAEDRGESATVVVHDDLMAFEQALATFPGRPPAQPMVDEPSPESEESLSSAPAPDETCLSSFRARACALGLIVLLAIQLAWTARSSWWQTPWIASTAQSLCASIGCMLPAWREPDALRIDSAHFVRVDDHYRLEWSLQNTALWPLRMPAMELILTGDGDSALVRRVLMPTDMVAPDRLEPGQTWSSVLSLQVQQDLAVTGYRLFAFYP